MSRGSDSDDGGLAFPWGTSSQQGEVSSGSDIKLSGEAFRRTVGAIGANRKRVYREAGRAIVTVLS